MTTTTIAPATTRSRALPTSGLPGWAQPARGGQADAFSVGLPLWWLAGLSFFMWPLITLPLVYPLVRRGELRVPRRVGVWLIFLAWMVASGVELSSTSRAIAWSW